MKGPLCVWNGRARLGTVPSGVCFYKDQGPSRGERGSIWQLQLYAWNRQDLVRRTGIDCPAGQASAVTRADTQGCRVTKVEFTVIRG